MLKREGVHYFFLFFKHFSTVSAALSRIYIEVFLNGIKPRSPEVLKSHLALENDFFRCFLKGLHLQMPKEDDKWESKGHLSFLGECSVLQPSIHG